MNRAGPRPRRLLAIRRSACRASDFLQHVAALVGRVADVVVDLHRRRADAIEDRLWSVGAELVFQPNGHALLLRLRCNLLQHRHEWSISGRVFMSSFEAGRHDTAGPAPCRRRSFGEPLGRAGIALQRHGSRTRVGQRGNPDPGPLRGFEIGLLHLGLRRCMPSARCPYRLARRPSRSAWPTSKAAGSQRLPSDQSQRADLEPPRLRSGEQRGQRPKRPRQRPSLEPSGISIARRVNIGLLEDTVFHPSTGHHENFTTLWSRREARGRFDHWRARLHQCLGVTKAW